MCLFLFLPAAVVLLSSLSSDSSATSHDHPLFDLCTTEQQLQECVAHLRHNTTFDDVILMMTTNYTEVNEYCESHYHTMSVCLGFCAEIFRASKDAHLLSVCYFTRWIEWEQHCWTEDFAREARQCYDELYPSHRLTRYYPVPYRVYDRHTIESACFPSAQAAGDKCPYYQSFILWNLLPTYFEIHGYPAGFEHTEYYIGFPGIDGQ